MRSTRVIAIAGLAVLSTAAPALGAWGGPERASRGPAPAHSPDVAVNATGDAVAVWVAGTRLRERIVVSVRPAGRRWRPPQIVSGSGRRAIDPQVAVDATGRIVVVWRQAVRTRTVRVRGVPRRQAVYVVRARDKRVNDVRWGPATVLSNSRQKVGRPALGMDEDGDAVASWHWGTGTPPSQRGYIGQIQMSERQQDGSWTIARRLSTSSLCTSVGNPRVAAGQRGHAVVWWQCDMTGGRGTAVSVSRGPGETLGPERELPFRTAGDVEADLAVSASGRAVAVSAGSGGVLDWWRGDVGNVVALSGLPSLGSGERVDPGAGRVAVAVNGTGDALSSWIDRIGRARAASIASGLGVSAPAGLSPPSPGSHGTRVAVGDARRGVMAWVSDGRVVAATRGLDGAVTSGAPISRRGVPPTASPAVAMDPPGASIVFWTRVVKGTPVVERSTAPPSQTSRRARTG
jgi:hypothetical protein